jgi:hypothetical protein
MHCNYWFKYYLSLPISLCATLHNLLHKCHKHHLERERERERERRQGEGGRGGVVKNLISFPMQERNEWDWTYNLFSEQCWIAHWLAGNNMSITFAKNLSRTFLFSIDDTGPNQNGCNTKIEEQKNKINLRISI